MKKQEYPARLLIFDLDGTIVDTLQDIVNSVNYALQKMDLTTYPDDHIKGLIGDDITNLLKRALQTEDENTIQESLIHFRKYYKDHIVDHSRLYTGVHTMLKHFNGLIKCILSNKTQEFTDLLLKRLNIDNEFDMIVGGQSGFKYKPDPESIKYLLNRYNINTKKAVIIGDSKNDIQAGKNAGIITCAVSYGFSSKRELISAYPDIIIDSPVELCKMIYPDHDSLNKKEFSFES